MSESTTSMISSLTEKLENKESRNGLDKDLMRSGAGNGPGQGEIFYPYNGKQNVTLSSSTQQPSVGGATSASDGSGADNSSSTSSTSSPNSALLNMKQNSNNGPVCKNCLTVTTPLWRRDENGAVLCNACGLFLKLHGRPRPISLKTDVIKSRNRKGTHNHHNVDSAQQPTNTPTSPRIVEGHKRSPSDERKRKRVNSMEKSNGAVYGSGNNNGNSTANGVNNGNGNGNANGNGNGNAEANVLRIKRAKINDTNQLSSSESKDIRSAATTLEILMSSDSSKPKLKPKVGDSTSSVKQDYPSSAAMSPSLSQTQPATHLPHLSSLLGDVNSNQTNPAVNINSNQTPNIKSNSNSTRNSNPNLMADRFGSPKMIPQNVPMGKQPSYHVTSINDVLNEHNSNNAALNHRKISSATSPNSFNNVPLGAHSDTPSLVRDNSQSYASPPPAIPSHIAALPIPLQSSRQQAQQQQPSNDHHNRVSGKNETETPLNVTLRNEEEVIKLKTRISELELVTDLYKRHIFELDERCKSLQSEIHTLKH